MPTDQSTDEGLQPVDFRPKTATTHVRVITDTIPIVPEDRGSRWWPLAPWRFVLVATALILVVPCGLAAAAPVWNGADLAVLICLAIFVAAFTIPGKD